MVIHLYVKNIVIVHSTKFIKSRSYCNTNLLQLSIQKTL